MQELRIYTISDTYISFLQKYFPNIYSNKIDTRRHTRKYLGVVLKIGDYQYYIPLSSPKRTDYQKAGEGYVIKKSIVPIMRIVVKNASGIKELKGTLRISHMIPVPESEIQLYDIENESDLEYKTLIQSEMIYIRKHQSKICANAQLLYKQKKENDQTAKYVQIALDYLALEKLCSQFKEKENAFKTEKPQS